MGCRIYRAMCHWRGACSLTTVPWWVVAILAMWRPGVARSQARAKPLQTDSLAKLYGWRATATGGPMAVDVSLAEWGKDTKNFVSRMRASFLVCLRVGGGCGGGFVAWPLWVICQC